MSHSEITHYREAAEFIQQISDPKLRAFLQYALTTILMKRGMPLDSAPAGSFDLRFYLEVTKALFSNETVIRKILDGQADELRWEDDD